MTRVLPILLVCLPAALAEVRSVPDPHSEFAATETVVWSPIFQATWDKLNSTMGGPPKRIDPPNALMSRLDSFKWKANEVMPDGSWKTWAGPSTLEFLEQANKEAAKMMGEEEGPFTLNFPSAANMACFGLLTREVEFLKPFFKSHKTALQFGDRKEQVQFFGVRSEAAADYSGTTRILSYRPVDRSHAIEISCKGTDEKVILYLPAKTQNFATACQWIRHWQSTHQDNIGEFGQWNDGRLHEDDDLRIPYLSLEVQVDHAGNLASGRYYGSPGDPWTILRAEQKTRFMLHEEGAQVLSTVAIEMTPFGEALQRTHPRKFIFDRPFFVFMWRDKAEWPYLGVWVGDTSAMLGMK